MVMRKSKFYVALLVLASSIVAVNPAIAAKKCNEDYYNRLWCIVKGGKAEVSKKYGRIDCMTSTHAVEADWDYKWKEGIGQSLAYAADTGKKPAILLIIRKSSGKNYKQFLKDVIKRRNLGIAVFTIDADICTE